MKGAGAVGEFAGHSFFGKDILFRLFRRNEPTQSSAVRHRTATDAPTARVHSAHLFHLVHSRRLLSLEASCSFHRVVAEIGCLVGAITVTIGGFSASGGVAGMRLSREAWALGVGGLVRVLPKIVGSG